MFWILWLIVSNIITRHSYLTIKEIRPDAVTPLQHRSNWLTVCFVTNLSGWT